MKKLMIVGAIAAATAGYGAETSSLAQVYDVSLTMKTGVCREGKATAATVKYYETIYGSAGTGAAFDSTGGVISRGDEAGFRSQATKKIVGVIWGCECETIAVPNFRIYNGVNLGGYAFWDQSADRHFVLWPFTKFGWYALNRIGKDFKTVEGTWGLANRVPTQKMALVGAGFGKASFASDSCRSVITTISGSFAGLRQPGMDDLISSCPYCGIGSCLVEPFCYLCYDNAGQAGWVVSRRFTAAYGTWKIKFNKSASSRLARTMRITQSYTFKKAGNLQEVLTRAENFVASLGTGRNLAAAADADGEELDEETGMAMLTYAYNPGMGLVPAEEVDAMDEEDLLASIDPTYVEIEEESDDEYEEGTSLFDPDQFIDALMGESSEDQS